SVTGFVWRMASSWGGLLLFGEYLFGWLIKRFGKWSVFRNLIPQMRPVDWGRSVGRAIFSEPPPEWLGQSDPPAAPAPSLPVARRSGAARPLPVPRHPVLENLPKVILVLSFFLMWAIVYKHFNEYNAAPERAIHWTRPVDVWPGVIQPWTALIYTGLGWPIMF